MKRQQLECAGFLSSKEKQCNILAQTTRIMFLYKRISREKHTVYEMVSECVGVYVSVYPDNLSMWHMHCSL